MSEPLRTQRFITSAGRAQMTGHSQGVVDLNYEIHIILLSDE